MTHAFDGGASAVSAHPSGDRTRLEGLQVEASIGVYPFEHEIKQTLVIDVTAYSDLRPAGATDELEHAVDYDRIAGICRAVATGQHHRLIETVASKIAAQTLEALPSVQAVDVKVAKPGAVPDALNVAVELHRPRAAHSMSSSSSSSSSSNAQDSST